MKFHRGKTQSSVRVSCILYVPDFEACLYPCVWCSVSLTRGVLGLRGGLWKMIFSCFATKAFLHVTEETHLNGEGLGWIIQHLQSISTPPSPHLDTSLDHRVCRLIMGMLTIPCAIHIQALWQHERLWEHGFLWVCNLAKLTVELLIQLFYLGAILVWKKIIWLKLERTHLALI